MNRTTTFRRKIVYIIVFLAMLLPLYKLGQPAGSDGSGGGEMSRLRHKHNIAESDLGEISPASETMKLATLGMRGVAATLLWERAHKYSIMHEWDRLKATLNNIALLQPHYEKVWEHQAHNLAYNVSTQFDDYRQRYEMVREGTEFLSRGVRQNREAPRLIWYTGWFYGEKMGMSDEKKQFRRLFADDEVLHQSLMEQNIAVDSPEARGPYGKPDNWLVGRLWLNYGYKLVDDAGVTINRQTPVNFFVTGPKWRIKHAEAIESEGVLDDRAQNSWRLAAESWDKFGQRSIPTTSHFTIKLNSVVELSNRRRELLREFRDLSGDVYMEALSKKLGVSIDEILAVEAKDASDRSEQEQKTVDYAAGKVVPDLVTVAKASEPKARLKAVQLASEFTLLEDRYRKTEGYRTQVNYAYWEALAFAEQEERTVKARRLVFEARKANADGEIDKAIVIYEEAFALWKEIFDDYPILMIDDVAENLMRSIRRYMIAIDSEEPADDFPLLDFIKIVGQEGRASTGMELQIKEESERRLRERRKKRAEQEELPSGDEPAPSDAKPQSAVAPTKEASAESTAPESAAPESVNSTDSSEKKMESDSASETNQDEPPADTSGSGADSGPTESEMKKPEAESSNPKVSPAEESPAKAEDVSSEAEKTPAEAE